MLNPRWALFASLMACAKPGDTGQAVAYDLAATDCTDPIASVGYTDVAESWGLISTDDAQRNRMEYNPIGLADFDNDGDDDVVLAPRTGGVWLHWNSGKGFTQELVQEFDEPMSLAVGDYDDDGWLDLWVGGRAANQRLYRNLEGAGFADATADAGLALEDAIGDKRHGTFIDYDNDGDLDLYLAQATARPDVLGQYDVFLRNDGGVFSDVSDLLGEEARSGLGWQSLWSDLDLDGDLDLYIVNADNATFGPARLMRNDGDDGEGGWTFTDVTEDCDCGWIGSAMGASAGDIDHDGYPDLYVTNTGPSALLWNQQDLSFINVGYAQGASAVPDETYMTYGSAFFDADHDTWLDLLTVAGPLYVTTDFSQTADQPDVFLFGSESGFEDRAAEYGMDDISAGRGVATGLLNDDGFLDIAVTHLGADSQIWLSECTEARSLIVDLEGTESNRWGMGARIVLETSGGTLVREITTAPGWSGAMHPRAHFGLGPVTVESMTVHWPAGGEQVVDVSPDVQGRIYITEP